MLNNKDKNKIKIKINLKSTKDKQRNGEESGVYKELGDGEIGRDCSQGTSPHL